MSVVLWLLGAVTCDLVNCHKVTEEGRQFLIRAKSPGHMMLWVDTGAPPPQHPPYKLAGTLFPCPSRTLALWDRRTIYRSCMWRTDIFSIFTDKAVIQDGADSSCWRNLLLLRDLVSTVQARTVACSGEVAGRAGGFPGKHVKTKVWSLL